MSVKKFLKKAQEIKDHHIRHKEESKHSSDAHDESNWLVSYADMMTLLCGFFVMLFSMAKMDTGKFDKVREEMAKQFKGKYEAPPSAEMAKILTQILQENGIQKEAIVTSDPTGVVVTFESTIFFDTLSSEIKNQGKIVMDRLVEAIASLQGKSAKQYRIVIEGHTDSRPILGGPFPSNWELSGARASRVVRMFLSRGFEPQHLTSIGYAETRPLAQARLPDGSWDEEALTRNRRVVLRVMEPGVDSIPFPDTAAHASSESAAAEPARVPASAISPLSHGQPLQPELPLQRRE